ncbi:MAG: VTC domain-containing protein [Eubacteriales bacterium]|nr:VTC domain-containing protein [Eubacteriales bacterium]
MNKVLRVEKKFLINIADFRQTSAKLEKVMLQDSHNGEHGYMIRSLYFDISYDTDFFEKQAGVELRRKIRLRCTALRKALLLPRTIFKCSKPPR